jgi:hypothetical protein
MELSLLICGLLASLVSQAAATALTYKLYSTEKACFYTTTKKEGEKIAFYFAVGQLIWSGVAFLEPSRD